MTTHNAYRCQPSRASMRTGVIALLFFSAACGIAVHKDKPATTKDASTGAAGQGAAVAQTSLGAAKTFVVLAGTSVSNNGASSITGDVGVSPGAALTGIPSGMPLGGTQHIDDSTAIKAQADLLTAYNTLKGMVCNTELTGKNLGGMTLAPGVYCFSSSTQLQGKLVLDAQNDPNAVFVFQIGTDLTTAGQAVVSVLNGSKCNVFWQIGGSATLGTGTSFSGSILAYNGVTLETGASLAGRALALHGAVMLDTNALSVGNCR